MHNVKSELAKFTQVLLESGVNNAKQEVYFLCNELLDLSRSDLMLLETFTKKQFSVLKKAVARRAKRVPLQIIIGKSTFLDVTILENKHTLTPRPETELLTSMIIDEYKGKQVDVLDLCSGSGCVGIAIARRGHKVTCADISKKAIACAKKNAELNNVEIDFVHSDMFRNITKKYDVIVSNPPYINSSDVLSLEPEVKKFDPIISLDGGEDGLDFYVRIANDCSEYLKENGVLYLEYGKGQAESIKKLLSKNFKNITIIKDYNNIERFIKAELK